MPYDVASPWAAASAALGGYVDAKTKKRQQDIENQRNQTLDANAQADTQARLGLERSNQDATNASRKVTQEQGAERLQIEHGNAARAQATADAAAAREKKKQEAEDKADQDFAVQQAFFKKEMPLPSDPKRAYNILQKRWQIEHGMGFDTKGTEMLMKQYEGQVKDAENRAHQDAPAKPTYHDLHPTPRVGRTPSAQEIYFEQHGYSPPTYSEAHPKTKAAPSEKARDFSPDQIRQLQKAGAAIPHATDPVAALHAFAKQYNMPLDQAAGFVP